MGVAPSLLAKLSNPLAKFCVAVPMTLRFASPEILVPEKRMHPPEERTDCCLAILGSLISESIRKEESDSVSWVIDPQYQGEIRMQLQNRGKEEYV